MRPGPGITRVWSAAPLGLVQRCRVPATAENLNPDPDDSTLDSVRRDGFSRLRFGVPGLCDGVLILLESISNSVSIVRPRGFYTVLLKMENVFRTTITSKFASPRPSISSSPNLLKRLPCHKSARSISVSRSSKAIATAEIGTTNAFQPPFVVLGKSWALRHSAEHVAALIPVCRHIGFQVMIFQYPMEEVVISNNRR